MTTTIQVSDTTKQLLDTIKRRSRKNYDKIIHELLVKYLKTHDSPARAYPQVRWEKKDRMKFRGV